MEDSAIVHGRNGCTGGATTLVSTLAHPKKSVL
jgi:hypothetical protein